MKKTTTLCAAAAALALSAGAASMIPTDYTCKAKTCDVTILVDCGVTPCAVSFDRDPIHIKGNKDVSILWHLPKGYGFCKVLGDGVFLKDDDDGQFDNVYSTSSVKGLATTENKCNPVYHWRDKNTSGKQYHYKLQFHDASGKGAPLVKDPIIVNEM